MGTHRIITDYLAMFTDAGGRGPITKYSCAASRKFEVLLAYPNLLACLYVKCHNNIFWALDK